MSSCFANFSPYLFCFSGHPEYLKVPKYRYVALLGNYSTGISKIATVVPVPSGDNTTYQ